MYELIVLLIVSTIISICCSAAVEVDTKLGKVVGFNDEFEGHLLDVWFGVPYGEPPIGKLRFRNTSMIKKFKTNPLDATKFTAHCPIKNERVLKGAPIKEDCLHLNIWRPANKIESQQKNDRQSEKHQSIDTTTQNDSTNKCKTIYPVLIYFYGGVGSIFMLDHYKKESIAYDGAPLAALGQLIVITVNYRSGPFGNLYLPDEIPANAGLFDQALSIEFVHKHIDAFCGDPNRITCYGNSLGSITTGFNLLSSYSNKYFQQAIMQSGSPVYNQFIPDLPSESYAKSLQFAEQLECVNTKLGLKKVNIECLQEVSLEKAQQYMVGFYHFPSFAGDFFDLKSKLLYKSSDVLNIPKDKKVLIGLVSNEIGVGGLGYLLTKKVDDNEAPAVSKREAQKYILEQLALIGSFKRDDMLKIADFYTKEERNYENPYYDALDALASDIGFNCPVNFFAKRAAKSLPEGVFSYVITKKPKTHYINVFPNLTGVIHADELSFIFGQAFKNRVYFDDNDREFSKQLIGVFAEFVTSGRPSNLTSGRMWPSTTSKVANFVDLSLQSKEVRNFDLEIRCDNLWWDMRRKLLRDVGQLPYTNTPPKKSDLLFFGAFFIVILVIMIGIAIIEKTVAHKKGYEKILP